MIEGSEKYLSARVRVPANEQLEALADHLSSLMPGFSFEEESTGRYEEVPAFVAENRSMHFVLLGIPEGERGNAYELKFYCTTDLPIDAVLDSDTGGFIRQFVCEKPLEKGMFMDFSQELAKLLIQRGVAGCKPILLLD